jgi:Zn-dependent alcohol dehydrogenase
MNIPEKRMAVYLEKRGSPLTVRIISIHHPGNWEVLVKMSAAPINPSDLQRINSGAEEQELLSFVS